MDLIFDFDVEPSARVVGVMTTAIVTHPRPVGASVDLLGVRFRPGEAPALLGVAARETRDRALGLREVCGGWGRELADHLCAANPRSRSGPLSSSVRDSRSRSDPDPRFARLDAALLARGRRFAPDRRLRRALVELAGGARDVASLAERVGLGERHLLRLFDEHVGIGPKAFARVVRVQLLVASVDAIPPGAEARWADLAAAHGFADQAHLVRELQALTGVTPTTLLRERSRGRLGVSETFNPPAVAPATVGA
jgi:AraC-like DNA-binding protein